MKYCWSIEKIKYLKKQYIQLLKMTDGITKEEKEATIMNIKELTEMENSLLSKKMKISFPQRVKYIDSTRYLPKDTYFAYQEIPSNLKEIILKATRYCQGYHDNYENIAFPKIKLSNTELVTMSRDFFKWLPNPKYLEYFDNYTIPARHLLRFTQDRNSKMDGETSFFYFPIYQPFFSINRDFTLHDFITLNHEIAHGIFYQNDNHSLCNKQHYYLKELEGYFFDFLSIQYLKSFIDKQFIQKLEYDKFISAYDDINSFFITDSAIQLFKNHQKISIVPIQKRILKWNLPFDMDESTLLQSLQNDPIITAKYLISFLTSLDLEFIYSQDPELAFYRFEEIRNNKTDTLFNNLNKNRISFVGENENYEPFQKVIQKMNQLRKK